MRGWVKNTKEFEEIIPGAYTGLGGVPILICQTEKPKHS